MKALRFQSVRHISYEDAPDPRIQADTDVIVKVDRSAVCGSDLHVYHGREQGLDPGTIMGHEFTGAVAETGKAVKNLRMGDRVVSPFTSNCGQCYYCKTGLSCRCVHGQLYGWVEKGKGLEGVQAEYVRVPMADATLLSYPEDIPAELALLTGDILATAYFCAINAEVKAEGVYVVVGCGPVGLLAILAARHQGAQQIYAVDAVPERLAKAREFGAMPIHYESQSPKETVLQATQGRGADAVMEAVGNPAASRLAFELIRPGGTISSVGVHTSTHFAFSPAEAYDKNITYRIGRCPARHYMESLIPMVREYRELLSGILTHHLPLSEGPKAYELFDMKHDGCLKVLLRP